MPAPHRRADGAISPRVQGHVPRLLIILMATLVGPFRSGTGSRVWPPLTLGRLMPVIWRGRRVRGRADAASKAGDVTSMIGEAVSDSDSDSDSESGEDDTLVGSAGDGDAPG